MDAASGPSRTAILTAVGRDLHRGEPGPWVLDDDLAAKLAGDAALPIREELVATLPAERLLSFTRWVCVRARFTDDAVEREVGEGVDQYVILGAGLDTFGYRRTDLADRLRVFEVDHPGSQAWKRDRLHEVGVAVPSNLRFAPVDFERQTLREGLDAAGFDFDRRAVFSWIGVTMYLTLDAIESTLDTVAACSGGTVLVLTYDQPPPGLSGPGRATAADLTRMVAGMGEPFVSLFTPAEIEGLVRRHGFSDVIHFGPDEAVATYFAGRDDVRFVGGPQRLITATVA